MTLRSANSVLSVALFLSVASIPFAASAVALPALEERDRSPEIHTVFVFEQPVRLGLLEDTLVGNRVAVVS